MLLPLLAACGGAPVVGAPTTTPQQMSDVASRPSGATGTPAANVAETPGLAVTAALVTATPPGTIAPDDRQVSPAGNVLRLDWGVEPEHIDPQKAQGGTPTNFAVLNYLTLMTYDTALKVVPGAAERVTIVPDGSTFTFTLRPNQTYSDGAPLTAANFEYAFKRLCDPEVAAPYAPIAYPIVGCQAYAEALATGGLTTTQRAELAALREQVGVQALDDQTLEVRVQQAGPFFLNVFALWIGAPVRQDLVEAGGDDWWSDPAYYIGNGPFQLTSWDHAGFARFERNAHFVLPGRRPTLEAIEAVMIGDSSVAFQAYRSGELDIIHLEPEDLVVVENDPALQAQRVDSSGSCTSWLGFNTSRPPFDDKRVRQAFAQALDREGWVRDMLKGLGQPAYSFVPPGLPGHDANERRYSLDPQAAKRRLAEAGFDMAQEIKLTYAAGGRNNAYYEYLAGMLQANLGVKFVLDPVDFSVAGALFRNPATAPPLGIGTWCADYADPQNFLSLVFQTGGVFSRTQGWSNARFDALTHQADALPLDDPRRAELYAEAQRLLVDEAPVAFFWYPTVPLLVQPWVQGLHLTPLDTLPGIFDLGSIRIETRE